METKNENVLGIEGLVLLGEQETKETNGGGRRATSGGGSGGGGGHSMNWFEWIFPGGEPAHAG